MIVLSRKSSSLESSALIEPMPAAFPIACVTLSVSLGKSPISQALSLSINEPNPPATITFSIS